jgi:hypothetical protein
MYFVLQRQMAKQLRQLLTWIDKAEAHAKAKGFDPEVYLTLRLAPDQFAFVRQVQSACDTAKLSTSRVTGKDAPVHADDERTLAELRARVGSVLVYLDGITPDNYAGAADRVIKNPRWNGQFMRGADYFVEHALPNFYFHLTHAYAILRHAGVDVGKLDYLGALSLQAG